MQEPEILHHPDARRHEQKRKRGEQSARRLPELACRERFLAERPPAAVEGKRDDEQHKPDDRTGGWKRESARRHFAGELKNEKNEEATDHAPLSPQ